jgi:hypothetical protein
VFFQLTMAPTLTVIVCGLNAYWPLLPVIAIVTLLTGFPLGVGVGVSGTGVGVV